MAKGITKKPESTSKSRSIAHGFEVKKKNGRPTLYTPELAAQIIEDIVSTDLTLREICDGNSNFPNPATIYAWMSKDADFNDAYVAAKRKQVQVYIDNSFEEMKQTFTNPLDFQMLKLKIEHIRWYASKLVPKLYGSDAQETENKIKNEVQAMLHDAMSKAIKSKEKEY